MIKGSNCLGVYTVTLNWPDKGCGSQLTGSWFAAAPSLRLLFISNSPLNLKKSTVIDREQAARLCRAATPSRTELATDNSLHHSLPLLLPSTQTKSVNLRKVWLKPKRLWVKRTWWGRSLKRAYCCARCPSDCRCRGAPSATPANKSMIQWLR